MNMNRVCSFRGVRPGEVFRPITETLRLHSGSIVEERLGRKIRFHKVLKPGPAEIVVRNVQFDKRTYVKDSHQLSVCVENGKDAIFNIKDQVEVIGEINDMLKGAA